MSTENKYFAKTESLQKELESVCRVITKTVKAEAIYLFGSRAYGTPTDDSDCDLCVIIPENSMRPVDAVKAIRRALLPLQTVPRLAQSVQSVPAPVHARYLRTFFPVHRYRI